MPDNRGNRGRCRTTNTNPRHYLTRRLLLARVGRWGERGFEAIDERDLRRVQLHARLRRADPRAPVHFGHPDVAPGPRRPLDRDRVAGRPRGVEVALARPRVDELARLLA